MNLAQKAHWETNSLTWVLANFRRWAICLKRCEGCLRPWRSWRPQAASLTWTWRRYAKRENRGGFRKGWVVIAKAWTNGGFRLKGTWKDNRLNLIEPGILILVLLFIKDIIHHVSNLVFNEPIWEMDMSGFPDGFAAQDGWQLPPLPPLNEEDPQQARRFRSYGSRESTKRIGLQVV